jgi:hypothetical protein
MMAEADEGKLLLGADACQDEPAQGSGVHVAVMFVVEDAHSVEASLRGGSTRGAVCMGDVAGDFFDARRHAFVVEDGHFRYEGDVPAELPQGETKVEVFAVEVAPFRAGSFAISGLTASCRWTLLCPRP